MNLKERFINGVWNNIWYWRISYFITLGIFLYMVYYLFAEVFPLLDKYAQVYDILLEYGLI